jgi:Cys-tRNA(Pro)/Cys-tRNA(Cys) deacylase
MNTDLGQNEQEQIDQLRQTLDVAGIRYNILAHDITVVSADEGAKRGIGSLREMAPTFILKTEKGYLAAIISGESRLLYKKIKKQLGLKDVSLATPEQVEQVTGAQIGSVSLVNVGLPTIIDSRLVGMEFVYGGCGVCCHTLQIKVADLIELTKARVFEFTELKKR